MIAGDEHNRSDCRRGAIDERCLSSQSANCGSHRVRHLRLPI